MEGIFIGDVQFKYNKNISLKRNLSRFIGFKKSWQNK